MHLPVILCGMLLGSAYGTACALTGCLISYLMGMPTLERLPFMLIELMIYAVLSGIMIRKTRSSYYALLGVLLFGRLAYLCVILLSFYVLKIQSISAVAAWNSFVVGLPGIAVQLLLIPTLYNVLKKLK